MITRPEHVALSVGNLDRSIAFYRDLFGFEVIRILEPEDTADKLDGIVRMDGARARIAHLELAGFMLELFEYRQPQGRAIPPDASQAHHGFTHLGFTSTDVRSDYKVLLGKGVEFFSTPVELRPGVWLVYFYGPDGEVCELRQT